MKIIIEELEGEYLFREFYKIVLRDIETINSLLANTEGFKPLKDRYELLRLLRQRNYRIVIARDRSLDRFHFETIVGIGWVSTFEGLTGRKVILGPIVTRGKFQELKAQILEKLLELSQQEIKF